MHNAVRNLGRLVDRMDRANMAVCAFLFAAIVLLAGGEVIARTLFKSSSVELVDLSLQFAILMYFLGYASLLNRDQDVRMDYFYLLFPRSVRKVLDVLTVLVVASFFLVLLVKSIMLFRMGLNQSHPVFPIPNAVVIVPAVLGAVYGLMVSVRKALDTLTTEAT